MKVYLILLMCFFCCCNNNLSITEKYIENRNNIINVQKEIVEISMEETPISSYGNIYLMDKYLIIKDWKSTNNLIYIFDKNTFQFIANFTSMGQGPNEIANIGDICPDEINRKFYVFDNGKRSLFSYDLDSVIKNPTTYRFQTKARLNKQRYPEECLFINDTLNIISIVDRKGNLNSEVDILAGLWNMKTGEIKIGYENDKIKKKRFSFAASKEDSIYVKCYSRYDLMTICNLDGSLRYNVYGPAWDENITNICHYNMDVCIGNGYIYALYSGEDWRGEDFYPNKIHIYNTNGDYLKTLKTDVHILHFCYDKENHRLILYTRDEIQFGYLDLEGII